MQVKCSIIAHNATTNKVSNVLPTVVELLTCFPKSAEMAELSKLAGPLTKNPKKDKELQDYISKSVMLRSTTIQH